MPRIDRDKPVLLVSGSEGFEQRSSLLGKPYIGPELTFKVAQFTLFLAEVEDCAIALREDQLEELIHHAVAACGFPTPPQARTQFQCSRTWLYVLSLVPNRAFSTYLNILSFRGA